MQRKIQDTTAESTKRLGKKSIHDFSFEEVKPSSETIESRNNRVVRKNESITQFIGYVFLQVLVPNSCEMEL